MTDMTRTSVAAVEPIALPVKLLLTVDEAAAALGLGRTLLYELLGRGMIESVKVGAARRIPVKALVMFIDQLCELQKMR